MRARPLAAIALLAFHALDAHAQERPATQAIDLTRARVAAESALVAMHGDNVRPRVRRGIAQVASLWRAQDGDTAAFVDFARESFVADSAQQTATFDRLQYILEAVDGHLQEIARASTEQAALDRGPILPLDRVLNDYDPTAHVADDLFESKLAFIVLLNFPLTTLEERLANGNAWSRRQWAEARLASRFASRVPASVKAEIAKATGNASTYIDEYNIWMHHLVDERGQRLFPPRLRLISHWNLRDEIKSGYDDGAGLKKQRMIQQVMERIVSQTIPAIVIDNPTVDWNPFTNEVRGATAVDSDRKPYATASLSTAREPDRRYALLAANFNAARLADPYTPSTPTLVQRSFEVDRELPESAVRTMLQRVLRSPQVAEVAALISARLGRPLQPFDIWYNGFRMKPQYSEAQLDSIVRLKYPTAAAFQSDIPVILGKLGFSADRARYVAAKIVVDSARGAGHAMPARRRGDQAHLRTRIEPGGMNYKGYNIAVHELGHSVEQVFSLYDIDHYTLSGVPNTAFTEALAFVFQAHDLDLLGLSSRSSDTTKALTALGAFWGVYEVAGVALVEMAVWDWLYDHPDASPAQLRDATMAIAKDVWNTYYAPVFGQRDVVLLAVYSHLISQLLYLPDYPVGRIIAAQIDAPLAKSSRFGDDFERMAKLGNIAPDLWMKQATGASLGPDALLESASNALGLLKRPEKPAPRAKRP